MTEGDRNNTRTALPPEQAQTQIGPNYKFSKEETRVLAECNRESFYQRSLPFGAALSAAAYYSVKAGYLKGNARFGAAPKMLGFMFLGYFLGKVSYQSKCAEKLMELPDSYLGTILRQKRNREHAAPSNSVSMYGAGSSDVYSDAGPSSSLDIDTDRPVFKGLEEDYKPLAESGSLLTPKTGYDELRKKNRDEHSTARNQPYKLEEQPVVSRPKAEQPIRNQYGDVIN